MAALSLPFLGTWFLALPHAQPLVLTFLPGFGMLWRAASPLQSPPPPKQEEVQIGIAMGCSVGTALTPGMEMNADRAKATIERERGLPILPSPSKEALQ